MLERGRSCGGFERGGGDVRCLLVNNEWKVRRRGKGTV